VIFPEAGITKGELASYYDAISPVLLPWVVQRPVSLVRCPQGRAKKCFFQKHDAGTFGEHVKHVEVLEKDGETAPYLFIEGAAGLLTCAQMGTIEFHGWGCRVTELEKPDRLVFDLDPDVGVSYRSVIDAAHEFRELLKQAGLETFPMTTGGKGLHVMAPLVPDLPWACVKDFAEAFARVVADREPKRFTANPLKSRRSGRIFVDYLRNARGATAIVPYSARARVGAPVATPVSWNELPSLEKPDRWTVRDVRELLARAAGPDLTEWGQAIQRLPKV
jgi:bifunctional non-homologous end joining protein LigD